MAAVASIGVYEQYAKSRDLPKGLSRHGGQFILNGKSIKLMGGAIHYWRVHPAYWRDRLRKIRACGLNCIDMYVAWNLHERRRGQFDFGDGTKEISKLLNIRSFLQLAKEEDLLVILRPGPYICSELDFGGLPSWLLKDDYIRVRSSDPKFLVPAKNYLSELLGHLSDQSFVKGGPIIAMQVENEYGSFVYKHLPQDNLYLQELMELMESYFPSRDILYLTSDAPVSKTQDFGTIEEVLQTANAQCDALVQLEELRRLQGGGDPLMIMEFWSGWFDHWLEPYHNEWSLQGFTSSLKEILDAGASFSFYMCHGGSNFGFTAGANAEPFYCPTVTSYDYDCLISENGEYTDKYKVARKYLIEINDSMGIYTPDPPPLLLSSYAKNYPKLLPTRVIHFEDILSQVPHVHCSETLPMEELPINGGNGQSFGYVVYETEIQLGSDGGEIQLNGHVRDLATVHVNGEQKSPGLLDPDDIDQFGVWTKRNCTFFLRGTAVTSEPQKLSVLVENCGRVNFGKPHDFLTKKGLPEGVAFNGRRLRHWKIYSLEFDCDFIKSLKNWSPYQGESLKGPAILEGVLNLDAEVEPHDTFIDVTSYRKGIVIINGFNLGRFWSVGPQRTLYVPAALLRKGENKIVLFVQYEGPPGEMLFLATPNLGGKNPLRQEISPAAQFGAPQKKDGLIEN